MGWIWRKWVNVGKKILAVGFVVTSAPFVVPPLAVATAISLISSLPYCFFLACYICTEKLMRALLPATSFGRNCDKMMLLRNKVAGPSYVYDDEGIARMAISEPVVQTEEERTLGIAFREEDRTPLRMANRFLDMYQSPGVIEDEGMTKKSKSLLESFGDDRGISRITFEEDKELIVPSDAKYENVGAGFEDLKGKKQVFGTRLEVEFESTTSEASTGKNMEKSSNKVLYSEEEIWAKMEALRKIVGYSVARSTTYSEELKALYMFTGVELPISALEKDNQDIAQVSERLHFLLSVIGII